MWGVLSLVRQGMRRRRAARVVDESAGAGAGDVARAATAAPAGAQLARALMAIASGAVRLRLGLGVGEDGCVTAEEAWAASGWRPARAPDEVVHLMVRESLRYAIYA